MNPQHASTGSLSDAHKRIAGLLDELNETVELVERLTSAGEHETALRLVEEQRTALYSAVDGISHEVGVRRRSWIDQARRHATGLVAAAALLLSSLAVSAGVLNRPSPVDRAKAGLSQARSVSDPVERLRIIERVVQITRTLPAGSPERGDLAGDILGELAPYTDPPGGAEDGDGDAPDPALVAQAQELARQVQDTRPPNGNPPPSTSEGPLEQVPGSIVEPPGSTS